MIQSPLASFCGLPEPAIGPLATAVTGLLIWLATYLTARGKDRAITLRSDADKRDKENADVVARAIQGFESQVASYQREATDSRAELARLRSEQFERDKDYGKRIARLERKTGRMHSFILEIYTAYVDIRSYAGVLDVKMSFHVTEWKPRVFRDITMPNFEEDAASGHES